MLSGNQTWQGSHSRRIRNLWQTVTNETRCSLFVPAVNSLTDAAAAHQESYRHNTIVTLQSWAAQTSKTNVMNGESWYYMKGLYHIIPFVYILLTWIDSSNYYGGIVKERDGWKRLGNSNFLFYIRNFWCCIGVWKKQCLSHCLHFSVKQYYELQSTVMLTWKSKYICL